MSKSALGRRMFFRGVVLHGVMDEREWRKFLIEAAEAMGMSPAGKAASWEYPLHGKGGTGHTICQPLTDSFLALDTWPDHGGVYLLIASCKPFAPDCLQDLLNRFGLTQGQSVGAPAILELG